jgi:hypothetical protein
VGPPGLSNHHFSVRWTKTQTFVAGTYQFALGTDAGGRLYVDGVLVLDDWAEHTYPTPPPSVQRTLTSGPHTVLVEYYDTEGVALVKLVTSFLDNGVTATEGVSGDWTSFGQENITLTNTSVITAASMTITVAQTAGVTVSGQFNTIGQNTIIQANSTAGGFITYNFALAAGQSIPAGSWTLGAQFNGTGTVHPTTGDTWTLTTTTSLGTVVHNGTF